MRELVATHGGWKLFDYARRERFLEHIEQSLARGVFHEAVELIDIELSAEHGGERQCFVAALGEAVEASPDHLAHAGWNAHAPPLLRAETLRSELTLLDEQSDYLGNEERVALSLRVDGIRELRWRRYLQPLPR